MKITKSQLKQIIKEELEKVMGEDKEEHRQGIVAKISRLRKEVERANDVITRLEAPYENDLGTLMDIRVRQTDQIRTRINNMNDKIDLLLKQSEQLGQDEPGQLERGE